MSYFTMICRLSVSIKSSITKTSLLSCKRYRKYYYPGRYVYSVVLCLLCFTAAVFSEVPRYNLSDMGAGVAWSVNSHGLAVGFEGVFEQHAFYEWRENIFPYQRPNYRYSAMRAVNDHSEVAGWIYNETTNVVCFVASRAGIRLLPCFPDSTYSKTAAIDLWGNVAGWSTGSGYLLATYWPVGNYEPVKLLPLYEDYTSMAFGMNDFGVVVGNSTPPNRANPQAMIWYNGEPVQLSLDSFESTAWDINNYNSIVGWVSTVNGMESTIWNNGIAASLNSLGGIQGNAFSINDAGNIVGWSELSADGYRACLWYQGVPYDLNSLVNNLPENWTLLVAYDIAESGNICGLASAEGHTQRAFMLTVAK